MKCVLLRLAALSLLAVTSLTVHSQDAPTDAKKVAFHCPVVGMPDAKASCCPGGYCPRQPNAKIVVDYRGAKLQVCCSKCIKLFNDAPAKYAVAANHQLVVTKQARQMRCPLTGAASNPAYAVDVASVPVFFASADGQKKVAAATPFVRAHLVFGDQGFARGFVLATKDAASE